MVVTRNHGSRLASFIATHSTPKWQRPLHTIVFSDTYDCRDNMVSEALQTASREVTPGTRPDLSVCEIAVSIRVEVVKHEAAECSVRNHAHLHDKRSRCLVQ